MGPKRLELTEAARDDLRDIRRHIEKDSPGNSRAFVAELAEKMAFIARTGFTGSPRDHVAQGLRAFPYKRRCIYFRLYPDRVVIVRVLHGAQDVARQSFDESGDTPPEP
ncbi:type II toxin-antitoxin system RelE/ParE family toxin [Oricola sp.]|uniref:type II toxin-antitoxin system RelE/ParE family toxin n=1 Tax=Oricola sp. TaxID=1979950 RepID=UPI0025FA0729|nr:type II toxin-antitoxin system RelE/ParE family toxin [Oricola sp.]MCI5078217.1 type II toxin-antitoxin system RelE/ParE family toxin [Oricola sp.]